MALNHPAPGDVVNVFTSDGTGAAGESETLVRTDHLEIFRYALPAGKVIERHAAAGVMVVQCLEGNVEFTALGRTQRLTPGAMLHLPDREPHALKALDKSLLLVTIVLHRL